MTRVRSIVGWSSACICALIMILCIFPAVVHAENSEGETGDAQLTPSIPDNAILSGAATYSYPIPTPPARGGGIAGPNLVLTYSSQRKSSWLGMGWDLDVGYIQRSTKWGVNYNNNGDDPTKPAFVASLNGSNVELVRRSDWDTTGLTCFGAKIESAFTKYCRNTSDGWQATTKDGTTYYFGSTTASRQDFDPPLSSPDPRTVVFKWCLDKVQDTNGNYMKVSYVKPPYQIYLARIDYNFMTNGAAANSITFTLDFMISAEEEAPQYTTNFRVATDMKLTSINIYGLDASGSSALAKSYVLSYNTHCPTGMVCVNYFSSMLQSITQKAPDGTTLPPVTFAYQWHTMDFTTTTTGRIPIWDGALLFRSDTWRGFNLTGDFDGDGRTDILSWPTPDTSPDTCHGGANPVTCLNVSLSRKPGGDQFRGSDWRGIDVNKTKFWKDGAGHPRLWVGDFNGDGLSDVATIETDPDSLAVGIYAGKIWVYLSNGAGFEDGVCWNGWSTNAERGLRKADTAAIYTRVGDFNGDGKADLISWVDGSNGKYIRIFLSTGNGFIAQDWNCDPANSQNKCDLVLGTGNKGMLFWLGDFNGDGKTDIAAWDELHPGTRLIMHMSNGYNFEKAVWMPTSPAKFHNDGTYGHLIWLGDFNGDGKTDIASWNSSTAGKSLWIHTSTGNSFLSYEALLNPSRPMSKNPKYGPFLGDFDGDGRTDIATIKNGTTMDIYRSVGYQFDVLPLAADVRGDGSNGGRIWLGDFDGDGRTDIAAWNSNDQALMTDGSVSVHMHSYQDKPVRYLLSAVDNGIGGRTTIEYKSSTACNAPPIGGDAPEFRCFSASPFNTQIVDAITVTDTAAPNIPLSATTYQYDRALSARTDTEREFYGFKNIRAMDAYGSEVETTFFQESQTGLKSRYKGLIESQVTTGWDKKLYKDVRYTYNPEDITSTAWVFPFLVARTEYALDGECELVDGIYKVPGTNAPCHPTQISFEYDLNGNITRKASKGYVDQVTGDIIGDERVEVTYYSTDASLAGMGIRNRPSITQVTDITGTVFAETAFDYYANGNLKTKTDTYFAGPGTHPNPQTIYTYDAYGNKETVTDPKGYMTSYIYDSFAHTYPITTTVEGLGFQTQKTWDYRYGKPSKEIDYNGNTTHYFYDGFGRISRVYQPPDSPPGTPTREYTYNLTGVVGDQNVRINLKTEGSATTWKETYFDGLGRTIATRKQGASAAIMTEQAYDRVGNLLKKSLPCFETENPSHWTEYFYDPLKRIINTTYPDGTSQTIEYHGDKIALVDANFHAKVKVMDGLGRLREVEEWTGNDNKDPVGPAPWARYATTAYTYDPLGNLTRTKDQLGNVTEMHYDSLSRKYYMKDPDMGEWSYGYDANGNLTSQIDAKKQKIEFNYNDPLNRIKQKDYSYVGTEPNFPPPPPSVVYQYDQPTLDNPKGKLTTVTDASGSTKFSYDERGRTKTTTKTIDGTPYIIQNSYDSLNRVTSITYPGSSPETVSYIYNAAGNLTNVRSSLPLPDYAAYSDFNAVGQAGAVLYGNNVQTIYTYDITSTRLTDLVTLGGGTLQNLHYDYDNVGNINTITDHLDSGRTQGFIYDELNRLIQASSTAYGVIDYQYNEIGNMMYNSRVGSYDYDPDHPHAVLHAGTNSFTYDANGNMTGGEGRVFGPWDYDNRPTSINGTTFTYDYQGQRVKKGNITYIDKYYECVGSNTNCTKYIFAGRNRVARVAGNTVHHYHPDHLGSSNVITNQSRENVEEIYYYPYGQTRIDTGGPNVRHKYTGQEWDGGDVALYYYGARYYNPVIGRFISADMMVPNPTDPQSLNRYTYALDNPLVYTDPTGQASYDTKYLYGAAWNPNYVPPTWDYRPASSGKMADDLVVTKGEPSNWARAAGIISTGSGVVSTAQLGFEVAAVTTGGVSEVLSLGAATVNAGLAGAGIFVASVRLYNKEPDYSLFVWSKDVGLAVGGVAAGFGGPVARRAAEQGVQGAFKAYIAYSSLDKASKFNDLAGAAEYWSASTQTFQETTVSSKFGMAEAVFDYSYNPASSGSWGDYMPPMQGDY